MMKRFSLVTLVTAMLLAPAAAQAQDPALAEARGLLARAEYAEAEKVLARVTDKEDAAFARAELSLRTGKYEEAIKLATVAEADKNLKVRAVTMRAEALLEMGKTTEAEELLRTIEGEPRAHRAWLLLGELLIDQGKRKDARKPLMKIIDDYNSDVIDGRDVDGLAHTGRALHLMRNYKEANQAFSEAERAANKKPPVELAVWSAELFMEKYNYSDAGQLLAMAEAAAPEDPRVRILSARLGLENSLDFKRATEEADRALTVNPRLAAAHAVKAGLALRDLDIEAADRAVADGLAAKPNDLELLSLKATTRYLADDLAGFKSVETDVLARNPEFSRFYRIVSEYAEWEHRYDDIIEFTRTALTVDPKDGYAEAQLGLNLIRAGREAEGVAALSKAADRDPFNVRAFNTLNLYEKTIPIDYVTVDGTPFRLRYAKAEQPILERYVPQLLEEAWHSMVKRYGFTPTTPISVELYADQEDFSIRTSGLPNVGIQGVCFGKSLAFLSPQAGQFNWGILLWHELGHVFAIQQSKAHVPRWFTEGLSEYETLTRRREWRREEEQALLRGMEAGKIPTVVGFNRAFTHVDDGEDVLMAYFAASQIMVYIVETYGWDKTVSALPLWAAGKRTPEVVRTAFGVDPETLDKGYRKWLDDRFASYKSQFRPNAKAPSLAKAEEALAAAPNDPRKLVELGIAKARAGKDEDARKLFKDALAVDPKNGDALYFLADISLDEANVEEKVRAANAIGWMNKLTEAGRDGYAVAMKRAAILRVSEDFAGARASLDKAAAFDPVQAEPHAIRAEMEQKAANGPAEIDALKAYTMIEEHDRKAYLRLLELLVERQRWEEARAVAESAIFVDVGNPELHRLYARTLANLGKRKQAIYEYNSAIIAGAPPEMAVGIYAEMAKGYEKLGKPELQKRALEFKERVGKRVKTEMASNEPSR